MIITVATGNSHKVQEMNGINPFKEIVLRRIDADFNPTEDGETFEENAIIKARAASLIVNNYALADDTGLCVDALNGAPGLHTARYAPSQEEKIEKLLSELNGVPFEKRTARFICNMVLTDKTGQVVYKTQGKIEGYIAESAAGCGGFGYDPIFYVAENKMTLAELPEGEKNRISHRYNALLPMLKYISAHRNDFN